VFLSNVRATTRGVVVRLAWLLAAVGGLVLGAQGGNAAAAAWSTPGTIAAPASFAANLSFAANGVGVAYWTTGIMVGRTALAQFSPQSDAFGPASGLSLGTNFYTATTSVDPRVLGPTGTVALYGHGRLVASGKPEYAHGPWLGIRVGAVNGPLATERIRVAGQIVTTRVVADQAGDLAVAAPLILLHHTTPTELVLAIKRPSGSLGDAVVIAPPGASVTAYDLATDAHGDVLITWQRNGSVYARWRRASGSLTATQRLGASEPQPLLTTATSSSGLLGVVLWQSQAVNYSNPNTATSGSTVRAALAASGGHFGPAHILDGSPDRAPVLAGCDATADTNPPLSASIDAHGDGLLAWTGRVDGHFAVRYGALSASTPAQAQTLALPATDLCLGGAATPAGVGSTILAYVPGSQPTPEPVIAETQTTPEGPFAAPQMLGTDEGPAELALDPANDALVAIWQQTLGALGYSETAG
jgi:hypothetical protein